VQRRPVTQDLEKKTHTHTQKQKTTRNQQNKEKGKETKVGKTAARGVGPVQARYRHGRGVGNSTWWGCVKRPDSGRRIGDIDRQRSQTKSGGGGGGGRWGEGELE
jgi:hypothetical protein